MAVRFFWALYLRDFVFKYYIRLHTVGTSFKELYEKYPKLIIISNHASHLDATSIAAAIPKKYWMILEPEHEKSYQEALTKARIALTKEGVYDVTMMKVLKKIRCKIEPNAPECSNNDE